VVHLWDIQDNKEIYFRKKLPSGPGIEQAEARFTGLDSSVFSTAFSPDRQKVVGVANSGKLVVWETQSGQSLISGKVEAVAHLRDDVGLLVPISFTLKGINCIRFTPDGRWLLTGGGDYMVRLFDAATGQQLHCFESHQDIVWAVAASRTKEGRLLGLSGGGSRQRVRSSGFVPGARDYAIRLWDLDSRKEIRRFVGHEGDVMSLTFRPNGRHFLSAGMDKTVRLWDIASGKLLRTYRGHTDTIRSVTVSPDGRAAVSSGDDCTIRYWQLPATVEDVMLALDKKSRADLTAAMRDLDQMGPELRAAYPKLVQTLCQNDKAMGELALTILQRLGQPDKEWVGGLRELLASPLPAARLFAAKALA
jgi:WD40 repeat protein